MSILSYLGHARKHVEDLKLSVDSAQIMEQVGSIADGDTSSGAVETKIELVARYLQRLEDKANPGVDETISLARMGIRAGVFDEDLDEMISLLNRRREVIAARRVADLEVGQHILISDTCRPKMLAGEPVEIVGFEGDKVKVRLRHTYSSKWRAGNVITLPRTLVGKVIPL